LDLFPVPRLGPTRLNGRYQPHQQPIRVDALLGACVLIRRAAWDAVGPFDEGYFMYVEEIDWFRRAARLGWEVWHDPRAVAIHHSGQSASQQRNRMFVELWRSRLRYYAKHHGPHYNRAVRHIVRLGMRAEFKRATRLLDDEALASRVIAVRRVRELAA
jgi:GT2 family glycosyltransferase